MLASSPVKLGREGVTSASIMNQAPVYEKTDGFLERYRSLVESPMDCFGETLVFAPLVLLVSLSLLRSSNQYKELKFTF